MKSHAEESTKYPNGKKKPTANGNNPKKIGKPIPGELSGQSTVGK